MLFRYNRLVSRSVAFSAMATASLITCRPATPDSMSEPLAATEGSTEPAAPESIPAREPLQRFVGTAALASGPMLVEAVALELDGSMRFVLTAVGDARGFAALSATLAQTPGTNETTVSARSEGTSRIEGVTRLGDQLLVTVSSALAPAAPPHVVTLRLAALDAPPNGVPSLATTPDGHYSGVCAGADGHATERSLVVLTAPARRSAGVADDVLPATRGVDAGGDGEQLFASRARIERFDPWAGVLVLRRDGDEADLTETCAYDGRMLSCGACRMARRDVVLEPLATWSRAAPEGFSPSTAPEATAGTAAPYDDASATYEGPLRYRDGRVQHLALALPVDDADQARPALASLRFGGASSHEIAVHRMRRLPVAPERGGARVFESEGDALLVLVPEDDGARLRGRWLSRRHGVVATLSLRRGTAVVGDDAAFPSLSGTFRSAPWTVSLVATGGFAAAGDEASPLSLYGWAQENFATARRIAINRGVYDAYANRLSLDLEDGRVVTGALTPTGLLLRWPMRPRAGDPYAMPAPQVFRREENETGLRALRTP